MRLALKHVAGAVVVFYLMQILLHQVSMLNSINTTGTAMDLMQMKLQNSKHAFLDTSFSSWLATSQKNATILWRPSVVVGSPQTQNNCLLWHQNQCWEDQVQRIARVWAPPLLDSTFWCHSTCQNKLQLIKVPKSASSTMAGLVLRLAHRHGSSASSSCPHPAIVEWQHGSACQHNITRHRENDNTLSCRGWFLLAPVRHPNDRAMSDVYFHRVSLQQPSRRSSKQQQPADAFVMKALQQVPGNYTFEYTTLGVDNSETQRTTGGDAAAIERVTKLLRDYDFMFLVDDMPTSLIVFAFLANLTVEDLVVASSKTSNSWYSQRSHCVKLVAPIQSRETLHFMQSPAFVQRHWLDHLLYAAVRASLQLTVQHIGEPLIRRAVRRYQTIQTRLDQQCANETYRPCSVTGELQRDLAESSCYTRDFGCGYQCHDRYLSQWSLPADYLWREEEYKVL